MHRDDQPGVLEDASQKGEAKLAEVQAVESMTATDGDESRSESGLPPEPPPGSRTRYAAWNYISMLVFAAVTMLTGLLATPFLVHWLGNERYGATWVVVQAAGYLTLLDLGLGGALAPLLARAMGRRDEKALRATFVSGLRMYLMVATITVGLGLALTPWIAGALRYDQGLTVDVRWAWVFAVLGYALLAFMPFRALVDAEQRGFIYNLLCSLQAVVITGLSLSFAYHGFGVKGQSLATLLGVSLTMLILVALTLRRWSSAILQFREPFDTRAFTEIRRLSGPSLVINLSSRLGLMTDGLLVQVILGSPQVTLLALTQRLATMAQSQLQGIGGSAWAGLAELHARGEHVMFNRSLIELTRLVAILGIVALGPIIAFNDSFLSLWVGPERNGGSAIIIVAAINALLIAFVTIWGWCVTGTGHAPRLMWMSITSALVNILGSVVFTKTLGVIGPLLGTTVAFLSVNMWYLPKLLREYFGTSLQSLAWAVFKPLAWGIPGTIGLWYMAHWMPPRGWIVLALEMGISALLFLVFAARVFFGPKERALWRLRIVGAIPRLRMRGLGPMDAN